MAPLDLPTGRRGQALAVGLTLAVLSGVWFGLATPLLDWYALREEQVDQRRTLARRMAETAETLPLLRDQARLAGTGRAPEEAVLDGPSDAIAAAALQGRLQEMAARAGAPLSSAEALPGEPVGTWRRIGVRVTVSAPWPALVRLLQAIGTASPRMLVDDVTLRSPPLLRTGPRPMDAGFTIIAFRTEVTR